MLRVFGHHVAMCCDMLGVVGSDLTMIKFEPPTPNTSQHVATGWPNARNMLRPTMLRYVALACLACSRLSVSEDDRKRERAKSGISGERDPGSRSVRMIENASGRRAGSAASGIRERKGEGFFPTRPHSSPARFFSPPLTESLEQAIACCDRLAGALKTIYRIVLG